MSVEEATIAMTERTVFSGMQPVYNGARHMKLWIFLMTAIALPAVGPPTVQEAQSFVSDAEVRLLPLSVYDSRAQWIKSTYITGDTEIVAAKSDEQFINEAVELAKKSTRFDSLPLPEGVARKIKLLKLSLTLATPADPKQSEELTRIVASMEGTYGKGKYCPAGTSQCLDLEDLTRVMANSRNPAELLDAWQGWHAIARPMRQEFARYVELANKGARELGFADDGAMWRAKYDMPPDAFATELDRLWEQVRPLYVSLHAYCRAKLREKYGPDVVPSDGPIPGHLLGNMWAQEWENIYPLVSPENADPGFDLTEILKNRHTDYKQMVRYGESFFTSLGFAPLPETFWERSLFLKPRDREVVCHASAWDVDAVNDVRWKTSILSTTNWVTTSINVRITSSRIFSATAPMTASMKPSGIP
jgi:peptidyl-dipeptidase A